MDKLLLWSTALEAKKNEVLKGVKQLNTMNKAQASYLACSSLKPTNDQ
jgi:hypothetical protein